MASSMMAEHFCFQPLQCAVTPGVVFDFDRHIHSGSGLYGVHDIASLVNQLVVIGSNCDYQFNVFPSSVKDFNLVLIIRLNDANQGDRLRLINLLYVSTWHNEATLLNIYSLSLTSTPTMIQPQHNKSMPPPTSCNRTATNMKRPQRPAGAVTQPSQRR